MEESLERQLFRFGDLSFSLLDLLILILQLLSKMALLSWPSRAIHRLFRLIWTMNEGS
jgi:hypothetical protein